MFHRPIYNSYKQQLQIATYEAELQWVSNWNWRNLFNLLMYYTVDNLRPHIVEQREFLSHILNLGVPDKSNAVGFQLDFLCQVTWNYEVRHRVMTVPFQHITRRKGSPVSREDLRLFPPISGMSMLSRRDWQSRGSVTTYGTMSTAGWHNRHFRAP